MAQADVPEPTSSTRCLYTTTPSKDFVLDRRARIVVGAGFSGHGLKFAPALGEVLADLAEGGDQPVTRFRTRATDPGPLPVDQVARGRAAPQAPRAFRKSRTTTDPRSRRSG